MFRQAERKKAKLRLGLTGASGSGKTWSALEIAFGMTTSDKIFFIDTESGRGELYQGLSSKHDPSIIFNYNYYRLDAPYSPERYIEAIKNAEKCGCEVLIIDSLSHAWSGEGGVLSIVDSAGSKSFTDGWKIATPKQNALIDAIITSKMHVITGLRAKSEYVLEKNESGKNVPRKIGLAPVQRDQVEYEFTAFMNINFDHVAQVSKDNTGIFSSEFTILTPGHGRLLLEWLNSGTEAPEIVNNSQSLMDELLPTLIQQISCCNTEDELRKTFMDLCKEYKSEFPKMIDAIVLAKDKRKDEIRALEKEKSAAPVIGTGSKHSQALTQLVEGAA